MEWVGLLSKIRGERWHFGSRISS